MSLSTFTTAAAAAAVAVGERSAATGCGQEVV